MPTQKLKIAKNGKIYLNAGCGRHYSEEWNNIDLRRDSNVIFHDIRHRLPYEACIFDAVYSSHVLEHLTSLEGEDFLKEMYRVCKSGGMCRIVVPDFERNCREYIARLDEVLRDPSPSQLRRYHWSLLEIIDQYARQKSGGKMLEALISGDFDEEYVRTRNGDEFETYYASNKINTQAPQDLRAKIKRFWPVRFLLKIRKKLLDKKFIANRGCGELHRWAYDRFSLRIILEKTGFRNVHVTSYNISHIPDWEKFSFDTSADGLHERKHDSLYMEGIKP